MARLFGQIPDITPGAAFPDRAAAAAAGVHKPLQAGISGGGSEGADSIVVSGGYEDDQDLGNVILYTGHGGNDPSTGKQIAHQRLTRGNLALAVSADAGLPVRVLRGAQGDATHSPPSGFRYDGLFYVASYAQMLGVSGFNIWRFKLVASPPTNPLTNPAPAAPPPGSGGLAFSTVQRVVRSTAVTQWVKTLHDYRCQVCGERLMTASGPYAEGAHLRPVGSPHHGPDSVDNVLCLCPNHHLLLDRGGIALDASWNVIDRASGASLGHLQMKAGHVLDSTHAQYQRGLFS